jgi:hypothetical protein
MPTFDFIVDKKHKMAVDLCAFINVTITGQLSGLYKNKNIKKTDIKKSYENYAFYVADYLNVLYDGLAYKNDDYVLRNFKKFKSHLNHGSICILHVLLIGMNSCYEAIIPILKEIKVTSYEKYMEEIKGILVVTTSILIYFIKPMLTHKCAGDDSQIVKGSCFIKMKPRV